MAHRSRVFTHCSPPPLFHSLLMYLWCGKYLQNCSTGRIDDYFSYVCCGWSWSWSWEGYSKMFCPHFIISTQGQANEQACAHALVYSSPPLLLLCIPLATRAGAGQTKLSLRTPHRRQLSNKTLINCFLAGVLWFLLTPPLPLLYGQLEPSWELLCTN